MWSPGTFVKNLMRNKMDPERNNRNIIYMEEDAEVSASGDFETLHLIRLGLFVAS